MSNKNENANSLLEGKSPVPINPFIDMVSVSYGAGILFTNALDNIHIGGFPLGFGLHNKGQFMYL